MTVVAHQSSVAVYMDCPASYEAQYVHDMRVRYEPFRRGSAIHEAAQRIMERLAVDRDADARAVGIEALEQWQRGPEPMSDDGLMSAIEVVTNMTSLDGFPWASWPRGYDVGVEMAWALDENFVALDARGEPHPPGAAYAGRYDYLRWPGKTVEDPQLLVRDLKSGFQRIANDSLIGRWQVRIYCFAALATLPGMPEVKFEIWNLRVGQRASVVLKRGDPWEEATRVYLRSGRERMIAAHAAGEFPQTIGAACGASCALFPCDAWTTAMAAGVPEKGTDQQRALYFLAAKAGIGTLERELRTTAEDGPIDLGNGRVLGYRPTTSTRITHGVMRTIAQLRSDGASDQQLAEAFPGASITAEGIRDLADSLAIRTGLVPETVTEPLIGRVPSATFSAYAPAPEEEDKKCQRKPQSRSRSASAAP